MKRSLVLLSALIALTLVMPDAPARAGEFGALLGGVAGGVIGNNVGPRSKRDTNAIWGALGGAFAGHLMESGGPSSGPSRQVYYEPSPPPVREYHYYHEAPVRERTVIYRTYEPAPVYREREVVRETWGPRGHKRTVCRSYEDD